MGLAPLQAIYFQPNSPWHKHSELQHIAPPNLTCHDAQTNLSVSHVSGLALVMSQWGSSGAKELDSEVDLGVEDDEQDEGEHAVDDEVHVGQVDLNHAYVQLIFQFDD